MSLNKKFKNGSSGRRAEGGVEVVVATVAETEEAVEKE